MYGHGRRSVRCIGNRPVSCNVVISTYLAFGCGSTRLITSAIGMPTQGITNDQASTQRKRYTRSSSVYGLMKSSMSYSPGLPTSPSILIFQGRGLKFFELFLGPSPAPGANS